MSTVRQAGSATAVPSDAIPSYDEEYESAFCGAKRTGLKIELQDHPDNVALLNLYALHNCLLSTLSSSNK